MTPDNKLTLVESGWFPKTLQIYDSNSPYKVMLFAFLPCDNNGEANDYGEDQPLEMNVTYDVRFLHCMVRRIRRWLLRNTLKFSVRTSRRT